MIEHLRTNTMIVSRMTAVSGRKMAFSTVTGVDGTLQPISNEDAQLSDGVNGRTFVFYCDGAQDVLEGDRMKDESNVFYRVKSGGVVRRSFNSIDYKKVICERLD